MSGSSNAVSARPTGGKNWFRMSLIGVLAVAVAGSTIALTQKPAELQFFDPIIDVKTTLSGLYVEKLTDEQLKKMQDGAINGMVEALGDPYTIYVPGDKVGNFNKDLTGEYVGIGASINIRDGWLTIVSPLEDSPAYRAGIMAEDRVIEIEGKTTQGLSADECISKLIGVAGTKVNIVIERKGEKIPMTLTRAPIKTRSVKGVHRLEKDAEKWDFRIDPVRRVGYVRLTQFTPGCAEEILNALLDAGVNDSDPNKRLQGVIIDLRDNGGGVLEEAIAIADLFLTEGTIVSTRGRSFPERVAKAVEKGTLPNVPLAVLVNGSSASASEVLAGALVENNRAIAIGTRSFGKGSVQSVRKLPNGNGAELKVTEQGYYLPSGRSITRKDTSAEWGVDPTKGYFVPMTDKELIEMYRVRRELEIIRANGGAGPSGAATPTEQDWSNPDWILSFLKDPQLSAAVKAVQGKIDTGEWKPTGKEGVVGTQIAFDELTRARRLQQQLEREMIRVDRRIEALETASADLAKSKVGDLWPQDADLTGGKLQITDKDGKVIATLDITGNNLQRWLIDADVKKPEGESKPVAANPAPATPDKPETR
ncbi:MAG: S41 family peptidase [Phycisphaerales bacterium]|nr:S41 family peptidase [Phycisphaerales bacterium]